MRNESEAEAFRYEPTERLRKADPQQVTAQARAELVASIQVMREVLFARVDVSSTPARRRALAWALKRGYLRPTRPEEPGDPIADIETMLAAARSKAG